MLEGGFILLHRSILRWEWYGDLNTARLFIHLLLTVNYEPQRWQGIAVERGQRVVAGGAGGGGAPRAVLWKGLVPDAERTARVVVVRALTS